MRHEGEEKMSKNFIKVKSTQTQYLSFVKNVHSSPSSLTAVEDIKWSEKRGGGREGGDHDPET